MKKIIYLLIFSLLLGTLNVPLNIFAAETDEARTVVEGVTNVRLGNDAHVLTRGGFAKAVYGLTNEGEPEAAAQVFSDVDINSLYAGYIEQLYRSGIITGGGDGKFRPDDNITVYEAYTMLLNLAGYSRLINGNYPDEVLKAAVKTGLAKGIGTMGSVNVKTAYRMLFNLLEVDVMELSLSEKDKLEKGAAFMEAVLRVYKGKGVVEAIGGKSLYGRSYNEDVVFIGGFEMTNKSAANENSLGKYGEYYYSDDDILLAFSEKHGDTLRIMSADIEKCDGSTYKYNENGRIKKANLSRSKDVLYNNDPASDEALLRPKYGYVLLTDNNGDGSYDVVSVFDYTNIFSVRINTVSETVTYSVSENGAIKKKELSLSGKAYELYNEKGKKIELSELRSGTALTVMESDKKTVIYQNSFKMTDSVTAVRDDKYITIGSEEYMLAENPYFEEWNGKSFSEVTFYTDIFGNIAAVIGGEDSKWNFAYVMKSHYDNKALKNRFGMKLLTSSDEKQIVYTTQNTVKLNGTKTDVSADFEAFIPAGAVIRYKQNSGGEITAIDTAEDVSGFDLSPRADSSDDCLLRRCDGEMLYKSYTSMFKAYGKMTLAGEAYRDGKTIVFNVPKEEDEKTTDDDFYVSASVQSDLICRTVAYNTSGQSLASSVVVNFADPYGSAVEEDARCVVIKKVLGTEYKDDDTYIIRGFYNGAEASLYVDPKFTDRCSKLKAGDMLRVTVRDNVITAMQIVYSQSGEGYLNKNWYFGSSSEANAAIRYLIGTPVKVEEERMLFKYSDDKGNVKQEIFRPQTFNVYIYDPNLPSDERVYLGKASDITDMICDETCADTVIVSTRATVSHDMLVIKKRR